MQIDMPSRLRRTIPEEADLNFSPLQPNGFHDLGISRDEINRLVTPLDVLAFDI